MKKTIYLLIPLLFLAFFWKTPAVSAAPPCNPVPAITDISPTSAIVGADALTLTVNGTGFIEQSKVQFDGQNRPTDFISSTQLTASIIKHNLSTEGVFPITVKNNPPCGGTSSAINFTVTSGAPPPPPVPIILPPSGGAGTPTEVHFSGRAYPGATLTFVAKELLQETPFAQEVAVFTDGNFLADFIGILAGQQLWGIIVKDKEGRVTRPQYYNVDNQTDLLGIQNLFLPPTLGFTRTVITKGDFLAIVGYAAPGSKVEIQIDGQTIKEKPQAQSDGSYKLLFNTAELDFGSHAAKSRQIDQDNKASDFSSEARFTISSLFVPKTDLNGDSIIDVRDASVFLSLWNSKDLKQKAKIDFNNDGKFDIADFSIFVRTLKKF